MFPDEKNTSDTRRPVIVKLEGQNDQLEEEIAELEHQLRKLEEAQEDV